MVFPSARLLTRAALSRELSRGTVSRAPSGRRVNRGNLESLDGAVDSDYLENLDAVEFVGRVVRLDDLDHLTCEMGAKWHES